MHIPHKDSGPRYISVRARAVDCGRLGRRVGECGGGIAHGPVAHNEISLLQLESHTVITIEITLHITHVVLQETASAKDGVIDTRAGRSGPDPSAFRGIGRHRDKLWGEPFHRNRAVPVKEAAHPYHSADAHGQIGVLAHKHEIRRAGILEMTELVDIEILQQRLH